MTTNLAVKDARLSEGAVPQWTLADHLRKAREFAGLQQAELALRIGISRASIVNYESGHTRPAPPVLFAWAWGTGVSYHWLVTPERPDGSAPITGRLEVRVLSQEQNVAPLGVRRTRPRVPDSLSA